jgi:hypothetical protein
MPQRATRHERKQGKNQGKEAIVGSVVKKRKKKISKHKYKKRLKANRHKKK